MKAQHPLRGTELAGCLLARATIGEMGCYNFGVRFAGLPFARQGTHCASLSWAAAVAATTLLLAGCSSSVAPSWTVVPPWVAEAPGPQDGSGWGSEEIALPTPTPTQTPTADPILRLLPPTRLPGEAFPTPTPDAIRPEPPLRRRRVGARERALERAGRRTRAHRHRLHDRPR